MTEFQRLVEAGIDPDCAIETCHWFRTQGNDSGLKEYVEDIERRVNKAYRKGCVCSGV